MAIVFIGVAIVLGGTLTLNYIDYLDRERVTITAETAFLTASDYMNKNLPNAGHLSLAPPILERYHARLTLFPQLVWRVDCFYMLGGNPYGIDIYIDPYTGNVVDTITSIV
ncbi:TPA: hypothetical protein HA344_03155 [Candidatus Bathyarchaeota archaeon]|nr:hypothetical protein [Candidatus Bathyarchaeota archaeon]